MSIEAIITCTGAAAVAATLYLYHVIARNWRTAYERVLAQVMVQIDLVNRWADFRDDPDLVRYLLHCQQVGEACDPEAWLSTHKHETASGRAD